MSPLGLGTIHSCILANSPGCRPHDSFRLGEADAVRGDPWCSNYSGLDLRDGREQVPGAGAELRQGQLHSAVALGTKGVMLIPRPER